MEIREVEIGLLKPYENNPRNNEAAVDKVAASISEFGFKVPIIIDRENVIVAGHTRYLAAQKLELQKVPCIVADDLTPNQIKAFRLADNKVRNLAAGISRSSTRNFRSSEKRPLTWNSSDSCRTRTWISTVS